MNKGTKIQAFDLATGTVIVVSLASSMAFIGLVLIGAIH
jgi:hypothetical protein